MKQSLVVATGARGVGKTTFLSTYLSPTDLDALYYVDTEYSANHVVDELERHGLEIGRYVNVQDRFRDLPGDGDLLDRIVAGELPWVSSRQRSALAEFYSWLLADLNEHLVAGKYKAVAFDTLEKLEAAMLAYVEGDKKTTGWTTKADGKMWADAYYPLYEGFISALYQRGIEVILMSSHLRTPWHDRRPVPSKVAPGGKKILYQLSQLFVWLVNEPSNADGAPAGLVLKERLGRLAPTDTGWSIQRALPRRLPRCTWEAIQAYLDEPADLADPEPGETLSAEELEMVSELLTNEQIRLMMLEAEVELAEKRADLPSTVTVEDTPIDPVRPDTDKTMSGIIAIRDSLPDTATPEGIAKAAADELSIPLPVAMRLVKDLPERVF